MMAESYTIEQIQREVPVHAQRPASSSSRRSSRIFGKLDVVLNRRSAGRHGAERGSRDVRERARSAEI